MLRSFASIDGAFSRLAPCGGNPCLHWLFDAPPSDPPLAMNSVTQCQSWPVCTRGETVIHVRCFAADGQLIQCCGHGLLAAAHSWQRRLERDELSLLMNGSLVFSWRESDVTWLRFNIVSTHQHLVPDWVGQEFPGTQPAHAAALAGDARGYLILQWPDGYDLAQLQSPTAALAEHTERALICTAAQPEWGEGMIQSRYFAPQYGVDEDAATGSAMRILADYWHPRFTQLTAYQCSAQGGWLLSRRTATHVEVGGYCVIDTKESLNA